MVTSIAAQRGEGPTIVYINDAFAEITGLTDAEAIGATPSIIQGPKTPAYALTRIQGAFDLQLPIREVVCNETRSGSEYWLELNIIPLPDESGRITHFALIGRDLTDLRESEQALRVAASTDALTGLSNRRTFMDRADVEFSRARRHRHTLAVVLCDIDHFRQVNDEHGHHIGDELLKAVAVAIMAELRTTDVCGRLGGEEFAMLLPETLWAASIGRPGRNCRCAEFDIGRVGLAASGGGKLLSRTDACMGIVGGFSLRILSRRKRAKKQQCLGRLSLRWSQKIGQGAVPSQ